MKSSFQEVLLATQMGQAQSLIGTEVSYAGGENGPASGQVSSAEVKNGTVLLRVGADEVSLADILSFGASGASGLLGADALSEASSLVGKSITFTIPDGAGNATTITETVRSVEFSDGQVLLNAGAYAVAPNAVTAITD